MVTHWRSGTVPGAGGGIGLELEIESRPSELPYIERVWRSRSHGVGRMTSIASSHWELVFWEHDGRVQAALSS